MKPSYLIILLVMNFFWAAVYSAYKFIGAALPPGGIVTIRFGLAALFLLFAWPWLPGAAPRGRDLLMTGVMGLILFVLGQRLQVYGNQLGTAGNSSVLMGFEPLITSVAAALFLHEHIGPRRWGGLALGFSGVGLLHGVWRSDFQWAGLGASLIFISSFVCEAAYSIIGKILISKVSVMKMLALSLFIGTLGNLAIDGGSTIQAAKALSVEAWLLLLIMASVSTCLGYTVWFVIIRECPVNVAALTVFAQSIFGVALAGLWLREHLHWGQFFGCLTIAVALFWGLSRQIKPADGSSVTVNQV
jgi:drug/metabolite transporter (DMT)-like permease